MLRKAVGVAILGVAICLGGCSPSSGPNSVQRVPAIESQAPLPHVADQPTVSPEPSVEATGGTYLCRVVSVSSTPSPEVVVDLITDDWAPGTSAIDKQRSSWPERWGRNVYQHPQTLDIAWATLATTSNLHDLSRASPAGFAAWWRHDGYANENFYVTFTGHRVSRLWPWTY